MKKIGIYGLYSEQSIGDHYILDGLINQIRSNFEEKVEIIVFSYSPCSTRALLSNTNISVMSATPISSSKSKDQNYSEEREIRSIIKQKFKKILDSHPNLWFSVDPILLSNFNFWKKIHNKLQGLDLFVFGGGNILMDLYPYRVFYHYIYSQLCGITNTPAMYYSIGAGPLRSVRGRFYFNQTLKNIDYITTRDKESLQLVEHVLNTENTHTELAADPALCLDLGESKSEHNMKRPIESDTTQIAVSLVPYYKKGYWPDPEQEIYHTYLETMVEALTNISETRDASLTFFATNHPTDLEPAEQILKRIDDDVSVKILRDKLTGKELVLWLKKFDFALCTRLHSLIPTFVSGTPFVAYAYQPKVQYFCSRIGHPSQAIDLSQDSDRIIDQTQQALATAEEWSGTIPDHNQKLNALRSSANKSVQLAKAIVDSDQHDFR
ncbi:polysaccharide pyruvyl transferase family protein [Halorubrum ezzemoulense]|uniref:polysaccharide pyruvyl transferase family protein n=1 Tax=Halorubrum ezzemoulense TaxID=337243 RepID=UPI00232B90CE|nr:polysaccharide pyruvyl transferase family protein [Halorubrum ezzemoulense]MDB2269886.1 polysaccharide pyruvyl transferase family protein [Halorubrum ezzemoulense]